MNEILVACLTMTLLLLALLLLALAGVMAIAALCQRWAARQQWQPSPAALARLRRAALAWAQ